MRLEAASVATSSCAMCIVCHAQTSTPAMWRQNAAYDPALLIQPHARPTLSCTAALEWRSCVQHMPDDATLCCASECATCLCAHAPHPFYTALAPSACTASADKQAVHDALSCSGHVRTSSRPRHTQWHARPVQEVAQAMMLALSTRDNTVVEEVTLQVRPHCAAPLLLARWCLPRASLRMREAVLTLQHVMLHHACKAAKPNCRTCHTRTAVLDRQCWCTPHCARRAMSQAEQCWEGAAETPQSHWLSCSQRISSYSALYVLLRRAASAASRDT